MYRVMVMSRPMKKSMPWMFLLLAMLISCTSGNSNNAQPPAGKKAAQVAGKKMNLAAGKALEIYVAEHGRKDDPRCRDYYGDCLYLKSKKPAVVIQNFRYSVFYREKWGLKIHLDKKARKDISKLTATMSGQMLAVMVGGQIIHAPRIKSRVDTPILQMTFCREANFHNLMKRLEK